MTDKLVIHDLRVGIDEAEDLLSAIHGGQIDALVVRLGQENQVVLLKGADQTYHNLFDSLNEGALSLDANAVILYANKCFAELIGLPLEQLIGRPLTELVAPADLAGLAESLAEAGEGSSKRELSLVDASGAEISVVISLRCVGETLLSAVITDIRPIREAQTKLREAYIALQAEIDERARLEDELRRVADEQRAANRRKDEFLAMLAHELRNPLGPIRSATELLRLHAQHDQVITRHQAMIERQVKNLARLLDDLLDVSRITSGKITLRKQAATVAEIVSAATSSVLQEIEEAGHALTISVPPQPISLYVDAARIEQVLVNLLRNAAKYTPRGGHISLAVASEDAEAVIRVRDDGVGIAAELLPHVFELFVQDERAKDRSQGGLGIGLTIVKRLVELHDGSVRASSEGLGKGCEIEVRLPVLVPHCAAVPDASAEPSPAAREREPCAPQPTGPRVLIVEDNPDAAEAFGELVQAWGYQVRVVGTGFDALALVSTYRPQIMIVDIGLPGMDGYQVARHVRAGSGAPTEQPLLIALTGYGQERDIRLADEAGFDCHLVKPPDPDTLCRLLALYREEVRMSRGAHTETS